MKVPFFNPSITDAEIKEVVQCLESGWLTTGPRTSQFEKEFCKAVNAKFSIALNSCTAALHLAVESLGLRKGEAVLVPAMTFAATAEVVLYKQATPVFVDCHSDTLNIDLVDAEEKVRLIKNGETPLSKDIKIVGIMPVHVGGDMVNMSSVNKFAKKHGLWIVEDAAHSLPAAFRSTNESSWKFCGDDTADVTCFSFYANKTITTGEGGMAVTNNERLANNIRELSLHGLSRDAWNRFSGGGWDYQINQPGYKYNLTDIASSIGIHQLRRAEGLRKDRQAIAEYYLEKLSGIDEIELPRVSSNRIHSWHLFPIRLCLEQLSITRNAFMTQLKEKGVNCSVHWRPLHRHPFYASEFPWQADGLPVSSKTWERLISIPIFSGMCREEMDFVIFKIKEICDIAR